jgi:hypothetical protein
MASKDRLDQVIDELAGKHEEPTYYERQLDIKKLKKEKSVLPLGLKWKVNSDDKRKK